MNAGLILTLAGIAVLVLIGLVMLGAWRVQAARNDQTLEQLHNELTEAEYREICRLYGR